MTGVAGMRLAVAALTKQGFELAGSLSEALILKGYGVDLYLPEKYAPGHPGAKSFNVPLAEEAGRLFSSYDGLVMIMALGIVFRVFAPHIKDKRTDPAVVVLDEKGKFVISALSGHLGGANSLAQELAILTGAIPVVTTATDVHGLAAVDVLSRDYNMAMEPFEAVRKINSSLVNGETVYLYSEYRLPAALTGFSIISGKEFAGKPPGAWAVLITGKVVPHLDGRTLLLRPRNLTVGIGCRRGAEAADVLDAIKTSLGRIGRSPLCVKALATVDIKSGEPGIIEAASALGAPLLIFTRQEINGIYNTRGGELAFSDLVQQKIGVGGVCEPVALLASPRGRLIMPKAKFSGVTVAVAEESSGWWEPDPVLRKA